MELVNDQTPEVVQSPVPETAPETVAAFDTPPEAVGEQVAPPEPPDPNVIGKLEDQELTALSSLQQQSLNIQSQIGGLEIRKAHMLGMIQQIKDQGQTVLDNAAARLGIKPGEQWSVGPDGVVRRAPTPHN